MLFSQRKELGDQLDAWTTLHGVVPNGLSYVTALEQLGYAVNKTGGLEQAVEHAAGHLPDGWQVHLHVENGAGWVEAERPDGSLVDMY